MHMSCLITYFLFFLLSLVKLGDSWPVTMDMVTVHSARDVQVQNCSADEIEMNPLWLGSHRHATRTDLQLWTNSNRKLLGISYSSIISWLSNEFIFLPYSQRLELSFWWHYPYIAPWAPQGLHSTMNCIWGTPPILAKGSCDTSMRSQRSVFFISTTVLHLNIFCYAISTAGTSTATGQESVICWSLTILRRKEESEVSVSGSWWKGRDFLSRVLVEYPNPYNVAQWVYSCSHCAQCIAFSVCESK